MTTAQYDVARQPLPLPWKTRLAISFVSALTDSARRPNGKLNRRLLSIIDFKCPPTPRTPVRSVLSTDVTVDPTRNIWIRVYTPLADDVDDRPPASLPVMVFYHGGGFTSLSAASKSYDVVCRRLAKRIPAVVVSVEYRLAPEHKYPSQYDDGFDALKFLDENHSTALPPAADITKSFLCGDSAGANLAHHMAVRVCRAQFKTLKVIGLVSIQPFFGGEERTESEKRSLKGGSLLLSLGRTDWAWKAFLPEGADRDHGAANVCGPNGEDISEVEGFPETMMVVGGLDLLQDRQREYYEWLRKAGKEATLIEYPNMIHAFYVFPELPESSQLFSQVKDFVGSRLSKL